MLKGFSNTVCHFCRPTQAAITSFWYECGTSVTQTSCIYCLVKNFSSSHPNLGIFLWSIKSWGLINFLPVLPSLKGYWLYRGMNEILKAFPLGSYYPPRACSGAKRSARWLEPAACPASLSIPLPTQEPGILHFVSFLIQPNLCFPGLYMDSTKFFSSI